MSKRNTRQAKARRRAERAARQDAAPRRQLFFIALSADGRSDVKSMDELVGLADAHGLLHEMLDIPSGSDRS